MLKANRQVAQPFSGSYRTALRSRLVQRERRMPGETNQRTPQAG
jgi:hypothetical protein